MLKHGGQRHGADKAQREILLTDLSPNNQGALPALGTCPQLEREKASKTRLASSENHLTPEEETAYGALKPSKVPPIRPKVSVAGAAEAFWLRYELAGYKAG